jgi:N-acyl-D-aspartate/D-glutamate deacylase
MRYDLVIVNGTVVDGTGMPRRRADVGVRDGRIAAMGRLGTAGADRVIDASGLVVAPGIVDPHTHYDAQLMFEPYATSSCYHGVTTVVAGNCGFSVAPVRSSDASWMINLFAKVEGMDPQALAAVPFDRFETFGQYMDTLTGRLGVNVAMYVGHCAVRRYVMGSDAQERAATPDEIDAMCAVVREAMAAGAAGFSSTHGPQHSDMAGRPAPSRLSSHDELRELCSAAGSAGAGSIGYLPRSVSAGGIDPDDEALLVELSQASRLPIIIQGLGGRTKADGPAADWPNAQRFVGEASNQGAAILSLLMSRPLERVFDLATGSSSYESAQQFRRLFSEASTVEQRVAMMRDPEFRDAARYSVERFNRDPAVGPTVIPPQWPQLFVHRVTKAENERFMNRSLADIASELGVHPTDALFDLALTEDLKMQFVWRTQSREWYEAVESAQEDPHMLVGTSDGGAHLDRDDGAQAHTWFLQHWVREWGRYSVEQGIRMITAVPAAACQLTGRGLLTHGFAADIMVFDPESISTDYKAFVYDFPNGRGRWVSRPRGVHATIVNGVPIVIDGELQRGYLPGRIVKPGVA